MIGMLIAIFIALSFLSLAIFLSARSADFNPPGILFLFWPITIVFYLLKGLFVSLPRELKKQWSKE